MTDWRELNDIVQKWLNAFDPIELEAPTKRGKAKSFTHKEIYEKMSELLNKAFA